MHLPTFTLLIVGDFAPDREQYRRALSQDSSYVYQLLEAESVEAGLAVCRSSTVDAILLDYALPDGDGLAFIAELNAQSDGNRPPVVMLTGVGNQGVAVRAMKLGAEDYLVKDDLTPQLLQSTIRNAIENSRLRLQLQQSQDQLKAKNQQITTIWESMTDAYITLDRDWRMIYTNPAATAVFRQWVGLAPEEFLGKTYWEVFPWSVGNIVEQEYRRAVTDRVAVNFEVLYEPTRTWFEIHAYPSEMGLGVYFRDISERKENEAVLQQAEATIRQQLEEIETIYRNAPIGMCFVDTDLRYIRINPLLAQINGASVSAHLGHTFREVLPELADRVEPLYRQVIESGEAIIDLEVSGTNQAQPGVERHWLTSFYPQTDEAGRVIGVNNVVHEITDRKRNEELLRQSEELNSSILDSSRDCIKVMDLGGRLIFMNDPGQLLMEIDDFSTVANWLEFWQGRERELAQTAFNTALAGGIDRFDGYCLTAKGTPKWWEVVMTPILNTDGDVSKILSVSRDITDRKCQEAALLQSGRKFSAIFNQTFQLMGLVSLDGVLLEVNQAALNSVEVPECEVVGKSFWEAPWWHTEQLQQQVKAAIATAARGEFVRYEVEFPNSSGGFTITDFSLKPVFDEVGRVESIVAEAHDITDRKQAQADLEQRNQELDSFVYVVSHDLKAPLRGIANLSEWIEEDLEGLLSVANQQQMQLLRSRVYKMQATIDGLLDYARIGRLDETIESVAVAELLVDVIDAIAPPPTFTIKLPPELPTLSTGRLPLFQVFANLIGNGIKHHDRVDGSIQISYQNRGDHYEFAIADDGPGIAPEHHDRMFKIFQAVNPQNRSDSTGIGLAIVKKVVEAEGGTIWLESQVGQGTTFYFTWLL